MEPIPLMTRGAEAPESGAARRRRGRGGRRPAGARPRGVHDRARPHGGRPRDFLAVSEAAFDLPAELYGRVVTPDLLADPALSVYLCRLEGAPVAGVCVVDDDGLAGISGMATLPDLQGRGIGSVLLAHTIGLHRAGARAFYLTASEAGQPLYRRHGFATVDAATAWVVPPPGA